MPTQLEQAKQDVDNALALGMAKVGQGLLDSCAGLSPGECYWLGRSTTQVHRRLRDKFARIDDLEALQRAASVNLQEPVLETMVRSHYLFDRELRSQSSRAAA